MIQSKLFTQEECEIIISLNQEYKGYSHILRDDRDYEEWIIDYSKFNFLLKNLKLEFKIKSLPDGRILCYKVGNYFSLHKDRYSLHPNRYKTLIIQLSNNYEGGVLEVNNKKVDKLIGNCVLFDSNDWHSVSEITSGTRYCLVFWIEKHQFDKNKKII
jgi:hypothetical protein